MKLAICQLAVGDDKEKNIARAQAMLDCAGEAGADLAVLPEMFCIRYTLRLFESAAEPLRGACFDVLSAAAAKWRMAVVGGSFPEAFDGKIYNTSPVFAPTGELLGAYRKAHMFDVDMEGFRFFESDAISPGDEPPLAFEAGGMRVALSICFDVRFFEWIARAQGAELFVLPAAFSRATGPLHWELLIRARALDNQMFFAGVSPAQSSSAYGHSMLAAPDGSVLADLGEGEELRVLDIGSDAVELARKRIPLQTSRDRLRSNL